MYVCMYVCMYSKGAMSSTYAVDKVLGEEKSAFVISDFK